ncbi:hypothetical protein VH1709_contig00054-0002 [Vibrio harveyi]|uniref:GNAT family N-acetyltransferase n=1 Tax=Vibrio harveyi TaxID=669 RepID=UPI000D784B42|nr:GNAT family N-acetyltransferase [Vibrio harveyi]GBL01047.1 hypothetical protein VH1709_contig00054-0002 [Vibrio harveyi]
MDSYDETFSVEIERFDVDGEYDVACFDCGIDSFNEFLVDGKIQRELERQISIPYVCLAVRGDGTKQVIGYFTLASSSLEKKLYPVSNTQKRKLPYSTVPTVVVGKIAVCKSVQGQGVGRRLLAKAIQIAYLKSRDIACIALFLKAFNEKAAGFYRRLGWIELEGNPGSFVFPLKLYEEFLRKQGKKEAASG